MLAYRTFFFGQIVVERQTNHMFLCAYLKIFFYILQMVLYIFLPLCRRPFNFDVSRRTIFERCWPIYSVRALPVYFSFLYDFIV